MYSHGSAVALRASLASVRASHPALVDTQRDSALHEGVCAVVDDLKAAGWPPERVIIAVKQIAEDAGLSPWRDLPSIQPPFKERDALLIHMVRWCTERYYRRDAADA